MSITLTYSATTIELPEDLMWTDEFDWHPVVQSEVYSTTGALIVSTGVRQAGRPITLRPEEGIEPSARSSGWITRAVLLQLQAWAAVPGREMVLALRGVNRDVIFRHGSNGEGFRARPLIHYADADAAPEDVYLAEFRFTEI
jgi:hypothetical protein